MVTHGQAQETVPLTWGVQNILPDFIIFVIMCAQEQFMLLSLDDVFGRQVKQAVA